MFVWKQILPNVKQHLVEHHSSWYKHISKLQLITTYLSLAVAQKCNQRDVWIFICIVMFYLGHCWPFASVVLILLRICEPGMKTQLFCSAKKLLNLNVKRFVSQYANMHQLTSEELARTIISHIGMLWYKKIEIINNWRVLI